MAGWVREVALSAKTSLREAIHAYPHILLTAILNIPLLASAAGDTDDLAKKTQNPVTDLVSLPLQLNYDKRMGADDRGGRLAPQPRKFPLSFALLHGYGFRYDKRF